MHNKVDNDNELFYVLISGTIQEYEVTFEECDPKICKYPYGVFSALVIVILVILGLIFIYCCYILFFRLYNKLKEQRLKKKEKNTHDDRTSHSIVENHDNEERHQNDLTTAFT